MPGDLNLKKSWHPGLVKNQQKLWQQEQDALKEHKRIKERQKEIEEEREKQDLLRLQYGDDLSALPSEKKLEMNKLSWMYEEGPKKNSSGFNEMSGEFLEGKQKVEEMLSGRQQVNKLTSSRLDKVVGGGKSRNHETKVINYGKDDPLLKIMGGMRRVTPPDDGGVDKSAEKSSKSLDESRHRRHRSERGSSDYSSRRSRDRSSSPSRSHRHSSLRSSHSSTSSSHRSHKSSHSSSHRSHRSSTYSSSHHSDSSRVRSSEAADPVSKSGPSISYNY